MIYVSDAFPHILFSIFLRLFIFSSSFFPIITKSLCYSDSYLYSIVPTQIALREQATSSNSIHIGYGGPSVWGRETFHKGFGRPSHCQQWLLLLFFAVPIIIICTYKISDTFSTHICVN